MRIFNWIKDKFKGKLKYFGLSYLKEVMVKHGLALLVIIILWEIIEDIIFPILFIWLGNNVDPYFYAGAPISLLICLHWLAVPLLWGIWIRVSNNKDKKDIDHSCDCSHD